MEEPGALASLSLTHVRYNPNDHWSYISAWLALVPQALCVIYVTLIWSTREVEVLLMFSGQMLCELLNFGLKRLIKEERPQQMHGKGFGMPSSHAQFVSFFSVSLGLFLLVRHQPSSQSHQSAPGGVMYPTYKQSTIIERAALTICAIAGATSVAYSRIHLNYHTHRQVYVGVIAGALFALVWFAFTSMLRSSGWLEWALETQLARTVRMRDLIVTEDLQDAGWARWDERRRLIKLKKK